MRIIVTGGAGFIGSHISDELLRDGHDVLIVDNLTDRGGGRKEHVPTEAAFELVDIRNAERLERVFAEFGPEVVVHQAAQTSVARSSRDPLYDADVNVIGTINVLNAAVKYEARKVVFASTAATYGNVDVLPITEATPQRPMSPYGVTKMTVERYLDIFARLRGLEYTILRYGNVYGPRQNPHGEGGVVAIFTGRFVGREGVQVNGDGGQTRDFTYVGEVARANALALTAGRNEAYVIGTGVRTSVNQIYETLCAITGFRAPVHHAAARPAEARDSCFDPSKAAVELGWRAELALYEGLQSTVEYYSTALASS